MIPLLMLAAASLPSLYWNKGPETAGELKRAGIHQIVVLPSMEAPWRGQTDVTVRVVADLPNAVKVPQPGASMRTNEAFATRSPWIDTNGWRFLRQPKGTFLYDTPGAASAMAAAEAFLFGVDAVIQTDSAGLEPLSRMLEFLGGVPAAELPAVANVGFVDDGSPQAGEVLNMLVRKNLLVRIVNAPDSKVALNVRFGSTQYPKAEAVDPGRVAQKIRADLTDDKRSLRVFGSDLVVGRLLADGQRARVQLMNYSGRPVRGFRVRVLGRFSNSSVRAFGLPNAALVDYDAASDATEFTIPEMMSYAVIDLSR